MIYSRRHFGTPSCESDNTPLNQLYGTFLGIRTQPRHVLIHCVSTLPVHLIGPIPESSEATLIRVRYKQAFSVDVVPNVFR